jgi:clan AA aspartic protease
MGEVYADLKLTNPFTKESVCVRALVDTGASHLIVSAELARVLGFDVEELVVSNVTIADGRRIPVPRIEALRIDFEDRHCTLDVVVLGDQCLMGFIPLECMDLIVDARQQRLIGAPRAACLSRVSFATSAACSSVVLSIGREELRPRSKDDDEARLRRLGRRP